MRSSKSRNSARCFLLAISLEDGARDLDQRARAIERGGGLAFVAKRSRRSCSAQKFSLDVGDAARNETVGQQRLARLRLCLSVKKIAR